MSETEIPDPIVWRAFDVYRKEILAWEINEHQPSGNVLVCDRKRHLHLPLGKIPVEGSVKVFHVDSRDQAQNRIIFEALKVALEDYERKRP
jgi:hypothetical protein